MQTGTIARLALLLLVAQVPSVDHRRRRSASRQQPSAAGSPIEHGWRDGVRLRRGHRRRPWHSLWHPRPTENWPLGQESLKSGQGMGPDRTGTGDRLAQCTKMASLHGAHHDGHMASEHRARVRVVLKRLRAPARPMPAAVRLGARSCARHAHCRRRRRSAACHPGSRSGGTAPRPSPPPDSHALSRLRVRVALGQWMHPCTVGLVALWRLQGKEPHTRQDACCVWCGSLQRFSRRLQV
jgi:hypothetical protein